MFNWFKEERRNFRLSFGSASLLEKEDLEIFFVFGAKIKPSVLLSSSRRRFLVLEAGMSTCINSTSEFSSTGFEGG